MPAGRREPTSEFGVRLELNHQPPIFSDVNPDDLQPGREDAVGLDACGHQTPAREEAGGQGQGQSREGAKHPQDNKHFTTGVECLETWIECISGLVLTEKPCTIRLLNLSIKPSYIFPSCIIFSDLFSQ